MFNKIKYILILILLQFIMMQSSDSYLNICRIHYDGGGDWYSDKSSLPNLIEFVKKNTNIKINPKELIVKIGDNEFLNNYYFYLTGHGNIKLSENEIVILREHLLNGAFLHVDDNYGLDPSFRKMLSEVFPEKDLIEIPYTHKLFSCYYNFPNGLPKIHEHDNKRPQALGVFHNKRLILLYTYESDLGDGWENKSTHNNPEDLRKQALKMGTNIIIYSLSQ